MFGHNNLFLGKLTAHTAWIGIWMTKDQALVLTIIFPSEYRHFTVETDKTAYTFATECTLLYLFFKYETTVRFSGLLVIQVPIQALCPVKCMLFTRIAWQIVNFIFSEYDENEIITRKTEFTSNLLPPFILSLGINGIIKGQ